MGILGDLLMDMHDEEEEIILHGPYYNDPCDHIRVSSRTERGRLYSVLGTWMSRLETQWMTKH